MQATRPPSNLPAPRTRLIGRDDALAAVRQRVLHADGRLVTLTGAGGSGKTVLALAVARELVPDFAHGAWLAELAPLADPTLVTRAVAAPLGVREGPSRPLLDGLLAYLKPRRLLLVLDNCEHLVDAAATLCQRLLAGCPELSILATSREPLGLIGEQTWLVPSLAVPDPERPPPLDSLAAIPSVQLFVERARAANPAFALTERNAPAVARVAARLDGIPLALELAAARVRALSAESLAARLEGGLFSLLAGGVRGVPTRQQTLLATLNWSHGLLSEPERALFRRLAVFAGGWDLEAAEAICTGWPLGQAEALDLMTRLVDKSLVVAEDREGKERYRLLEPIRQYAAEHLTTGDDEASTRRRHAEHFLALAQAADRQLRGPRQPSAYAWFTREANNLRAALDWAEGVGADGPGLALAAALGWYWFYDGHSVEGERWLRTFLVRSPGGSTTRARALASLALVTLVQGNDGDDARPAALADEARALAHRLGDAPGEAFAALALSYGLLRRNGPAAGRRAAVEARALAGGDRWLAAFGLVSEAHALRLLGDLAAAEASYREAVALFRAAGARREAASAGGMDLATVLQQQGRYAEAAALTREGLGVLHAQGTLWGVPEALDTIAMAEAAAGRAERAARLFGAAEALREAEWRNRFAHHREDLERQEAMVRAALDEATFATTWAIGRKLTAEQAIAEALADPEQAAPAPVPYTPAKASSPAAGDHGPLTQREREVLALLARGLSNQQIATELVITQGTAAFHVHNILGKLDLTSRARAAAWAVARGLAADPDG